MIVRSCDPDVPRRSLARVGVHLGVPSQFSAVEWYGRGPHENYADRKYGAFLRRHVVERLEQLHTPYIFTGADWSIAAAHASCLWWARPVPSMCCPQLATHFIIAHLLVMDI